MQSTKAFESRVAAMVQAVREEFSLLNSNCNEFNFTIEAKGRVNDGSVKIEYSTRVGWDSGTVSGATLNATVRETMRRHGWNESNRPLAITFDKWIAVPADD